MGRTSSATILVLAAYVLIGIWQERNDCTGPVARQCYQVQDPLDLAVVAAAVLGACVGSLWWNAPPAKIIMGDTGSLALGGALAGLAICTKAQLLLVILGGLYVIITMSGVIQVTVFKVTRIRTGRGKRVFKMAAARASLRAARLVGRDDRHQVLADLRAARGAWPRHLLHRRAADLTREGLPWIRGACNRGLNERTRRGRQAAIRSSVRVRLPRTEIVTGPPSIAAGLCAPGTGA